MKERTGTELVWITTDEDGEIETMSAAAGELLGLSSARARGQNLFLFFPSSVRAMVLDAEIACTGWPNGRTVTLEPLTRGSVSVRYLVSAHLEPGVVRLNWFFDLETAARRAH
jgi:PAS domain-containing protein